MNAHSYSVASGAGLAVASTVGAFSYLKPLLLERPLVGFFGFDLAPYTGLSSIIVLVALNLVNRNTWKSKYDQEVETSNRLRGTLDDLMKKNEYYMKENAYLKSALGEHGPK